jgi:adenylate cyclase
VCDGIESSDPSDLDTGGGRMSDPDTLEGKAALKSDDELLAPKEKTRFFSDRLRHRLRAIGTVVASVAAVGAVGSGLLGYWNVWKTVKTEILHEGQSLQKYAASRPDVVPRLSLVVLPFANLNNDPAQNYFADGITTDLTTDLGRMPGCVYRKPHPS